MTSGTILKPSANHLNADILTQTLGGPQRRGRTTGQSYGPPEPRLEQLSVLNLSSYTLTKQEEQVLGLGLNSCTDQTTDKFTIVKDLYLFTRKLTFKYVNDKDRTRKVEDKSDIDQYKGYTMADFRALRDLIQLLNENQEEGEGGPDTVPQSPDSTENISEIDRKTFRPKSQKFPPLKSSPCIWAFLTKVTKAVEQLNFPPIQGGSLNQKQLQALNNLSDNLSIVIKPADKGGKVVVMD